MRRMSSLRHAGDADSAAMIESVLLKLHGRAQAARGRRDSTSLPIRLDVTVMDLWNADVKSETFDTKVRVRARWLCPKEHAEEALQHGEDGLDADWEPEWVPHISFACTTSEALDHSYFIAQREGELTWITGEWTFTARIVSRSPSAPLPAATPAAPLTRAVAHTAPCPTYLPWQLEAYDLHHFPFDVQDFNIILSIDNADVGIELKAIDSTAKLARSPKKWRTWNTMATDKTPVRVDAAALELPDFRTLSERDDGTNWLERPALFRKTDNNEVHIVLLYERNPSFYVVNYMLLLFFISSSVAFSWSVPWPKVEDRLALDVTLLLTSVAFKQVLAGTVPPISYLTRIDAYALGSLFFLLLATGMHAIVGFLIEDCDEPGGILECTFRAGLTASGIRTLDWTFFWVFLGCWSIANGLYIYSVRRQLWKGNQAYSLAHAKMRNFEPALIEKPALEWYEEESPPRSFMTGPSASADTSRLNDGSTPSNTEMKGAAM